MNHRRRRNLTPARVRVNIRSQGRIELHDAGIEPLIRAVKSFPHPASREAILCTCAYSSARSPPFAEAAEVSSKGALAARRRAGNRRIKGRDGGEWPGLAATPKNTKNKATQNLRKKHCPARRIVFT